MRCCGPRAQYGGGGGGGDSPRRLADNQAPVAPCAEVGLCLEKRALQRSDALSRWEDGAIKARPDGCPVFELYGVRMPSS